LQDLEATLAGTDAHERSHPIHDAKAWEPGDRIGRYIVLDKLGAGAMGIVVAAYDPALDRRVAIKLIHDPGAPNAHRKLREAQTLARLSHPNVVAVHDVGEIEGDAVVFIAMEYIAGITLQRWLEQPRSIREIVAVFLQAGRGLAAAHAAGVTHRDFKPANVMIGDDPQGIGRVRVMDFGLARAQTTDPTKISDGYAPGKRASGTPAYMAPEQHLERSVGPAADQFAFCVALHEALAGARPFVGASPAEIAYSVTHDSPAAPPRALPENVRRVLERGLTRLPERRFPDMDALLRELARDPRRARLRWLGASGVVLAFAGALLALRDDDPTCDRLADEIEEVWTEDQRAQLRSGLAAATSADVATRTTEELDRFAAAWRAQRSAACIDARDGTTEPELVERRTACLENGRQQFAAIVDTLAREDAERPFEVLAVLPSLRSCADGKILRLTAPLPDPEIRADVARVRGLLARELALEVAGRLEEAASILADAERETAALRDDALRAELDASRGRVMAINGDFEGAAQVLASSVWTALRARHHGVAIRSATRLVFVTGDHFRDTATGELWFGLAESLLVAAEVEDSPLWAELWQVRGAMLLRANRHDESRDASTRALELARRLQDHRVVTLALQGLALSQRQLHQYDRSNETATEAIGILREAYGDAHVVIGILQGLVGANLISLDEPERAAVALREATESLERTLPPTHFKVVETRWNACLLEEYRGRYREAIACFEDLHTVVGNDPELASHWLSGIFEQLLHSTIRSGDFAQIDRILANPYPVSDSDQWSVLARAEVAVLEGRLDDADRLLEDRIAALDRRHGPHPTEAFWARYASARLDLRAGRAARAEATIAELEPLRAELAEYTVPFLDALHGRVLLAAGAPQRALPKLDAATKILYRQLETRDWPETAEALAALARTHAELGSDRATMTAAAHRAIEIYERLPGYRIDRDAFATWLARADTGLHD
jgi:hypothetical protein